MLRIIARICARAGREAELRVVLRELLPATRSESGCLAYQLFQNADRVGEFVTVEQWTDQAAADAHLASPHVAAALARATDLLAQPPQIHRFDEVN
ncbi:putative quinol monooxygenase [Accumulibacter sp.]|uniref:putative quinol monooxygenase n=1 Tax=Accumulibacter sp. TaxID=2053492 RepID=UPI0026034074|nr:putative quinol monooxygenase [Accumulibacter sp.]